MVVNGGPDEVEVDESRLAWSKRSLARLARYSFSVP